MRLARWVRRLAFLGAAGCVAAAALPGSAGADDSSGPNAYSTRVQARGFQFILDSTPEPTPFSDLIDATVPLTGAELLAGGLSSSFAESVSEGGGENLPGAPCLFSSQLCPPGYPPDWPFTARASYPTQPSADAPAGGSSLGPVIGVAPGASHAEATEKSATARAGAVDGTALKGTPLEVSVGSVRSVSDLEVTDKGLVSIAESTAKNISIAGVVTIKSVTTHLEVVNNGTSKPVNHSSVTVQGAEVNGQPATIDDKGVHVAGQGGANPLGGVTGAADPLKALGLDIATVGIAKVASDPHSLDLTGVGLSVKFDRSFSELCTLKAACDPLPRLCKQPPSTPLDPIVSQLAVVVDLCQPSLPSPRDIYFSHVFIASATLTNYAADFSFPPPPPPPTTTGTTGTTGVPTTGASGPVGPPISSGGTTGITTGGTTAPPPVTAAGGTTGGGVTAGYVENFGDAAKRLKWIFPALLLAAIGVLAGRVQKSPPRLPKAAG